MAYRRKRKHLPRHVRRAGRARDAIPRQLYFCYAIFARALWRTRVSWCSATAGAAVGTTAGSSYLDGIDFHFSRKTDGALFC
ncbi:hypothetical protein T12_6525 [Trichinella patagoniensis]|uniref:Uncharacterized protein n=1 Tax=Trichinella patagoniensis TaxID=990121 RepID=A0A0V1A8M3_9BILA|nr:hypothetical protein T12_6525 [Trichinella patagoniensis]